jgi:hypothetical protein
VPNSPTQYVPLSFHLMTETSSLRKVVFFYIRRWAISRNLITRSSGHLKTVLWQPKALNGGEESHGMESPCPMWVRNRLIIALQVTADVNERTTDNYIDNPAEQQATHETKQTRHLTARMETQLH